MEAKGASSALNEASLYLSDLSWLYADGYERIMIGAGHGSIQ